MCGIGGGFCLEHSRRVDPDRVERISALLAHRGPDGAGIFASADGRLRLAHRRLSVIDLVTGDQPMTDESGRYTVVFNGEIYNYIEVRDELRAQGFSFRTRSDTEVLLHLWAAHGIDGLRRLTGMFAFALWDDVTKELVLARDRIGEKPLYWSVEDDVLYFASSFRALRRTSARPARTDPHAVDLFLDLGYVPAPQTIDSNISKLEAGTLLRAGPGGPRVERYWEIEREPEPFDGSYEEAVDRLDERINRSVEIRLRSDVPLGVFLSGGVDSSLVTAVAARHAKDRVLTFSIGFGEKKYDETGFASAVARHVGTEHRAFQLRWDVMGVLPGLIDHFGEPFGDPTALPTSMLARETRRHVKVAVGGDGGDEGFGGYDWYHNAARLERMRRVVPGSIAVAGTRVLSAAGSMAGGNRAFARARRGMSLLAMDGARRFASLRSFIGRAEAEALYAGDLAAARNEAAADARDRLAELFAAASGTPLRRMRLVDLATYLPDCMMPKVDVATMAHGLEARAPLLDHGLIEFALRLPDAWLVDRQGGKRILRDVLARYVPREMFERPKQGFTVPLDRWFENGLRASVDVLGDSESLAGTGWFRPAGIRSIVREHLAGQRDHSQRIYSLLVLDRWLRNG